MSEAGQSQALPTLAGADWLARPETQAVFQALRGAGYDARAVGGAVRNALIGHPVADVDIATPATPEAVILACEAAGLKCVPTGLAHGTVTVISGATPYEVTTLRRDVETFGRHATVAFTDDWEADARRRDFTINALYCASDGTILDPLGGYPDLLARRVRFIGEPAERIREDYLRILRFFRFHAEYAIGQPDRSALEACVRERNGLAQLAAERIRAEFMKLIIAPGAVGALEAMGDWGLLSPLLGVAPRPGLFQRLVAAEGVLNAAADVAARLSALAIAVEEDIGRLAARLRLANDERDELLAADLRLGQVAGLSDQRARARLYRLGTRQWRTTVRLAAAVCAQTHWPRLVELAALPETWPAPRLPVRGADVTAAGVPEGPEVGRILAQLEAWWIESDFPSDVTLVRGRLVALVAQRSQSV